MKSYRSLIERLILFSTGLHKADKWFKCRPLKEPVWRHRHEDQQYPDRSVCCKYQFGDLKKKKLKLYNFIKTGKQRNRCAKKIEVRKSSVIKSICFEIFP